MVLPEKIITDDCSTSCANAIQYAARPTVAYLVLPLHKSGQIRLHTFAQPEPRISVILGSTSELKKVAGFDFIM